MRGGTHCTNLDAFSLDRLGLYSSLVALIVYFKSVHHAYILLSREKIDTVIAGFCFLEGKCVEQKETSKDRETIFPMTKNLPLKTFIELMDSWSGDLKCSETFFSSS